MAGRLVQGTARLVEFKAYLLSTGLEATGLANIAITISKNGATSFSNPAAGGTNATEMAFGWYKVQMGVGDTDTLGPLAIRGASATIQDVGIVYDIVSGSTAGLADVYEDAAVWIDTVNGAAGIVAYVNGTKYSPCSTLASAVTIAAAVGLRRFRVINGSSITLAGAYTDWTFKSDNFATIALGGQALTNVTIDGFIVSGTATTGLLGFENCSLLAIAVPPNTTMEHSTFVGPITMGAAGDYYVFDSEAANVGGSPVSFDFGAGLGNSTLNIRKWTGTLSLANMGQSGTDAAAVAGEGRLEIAASCIGGTVRIAGHLTLANSGTGQTIIQGPNYYSTNAAGMTQADLVSMGGVTQSATDLKDFADDGYDPTTNKVQGVVLTDTVTTYTGNTPQTGDAFAAIGVVPTANQNADALLDRANAIEAGVTPRQAQRLILAEAAGKVSGAATATNIFRNAVADSKDRITATVDVDGNRTAISYDTST